MLKELKEHPLLSGLSALAAVIGAANSASVTIGLRPFFADVLAIVLLAATGSFWLNRAIARPPETAATIIDATGKVVASRRSRLELVRLPLLLGVAMFALFFWSVRAPIRHLTRLGGGRWSVCGQFHAPCGMRACVALLDEKGRPTGETCKHPEDASGYLLISATSWLDYKPSFVEATCGSQTTSRVRLPLGCFGSVCDERVMLE